MSPAYLIDAQVRVRATQQGQRRLGQASILLIEIYQICGICGGRWWWRRARCRSSNRSGVRPSGVKGAPSTLGHALRSVGF